MIKSELSKLHDLVSIGLNELVQLMIKHGLAPTQGFLKEENRKYDSNTFMIRPYCWCQQKECIWCRYDKAKGSMPNFHHKATDYKVWWCFNIGRGMKVENPQNVDFSEVLIDCLKDIRREK